MLYSSEAADMLMQMPRQTPASANTDTRAFHVQNDRIGHEDRHQLSKWSTRERQQTLN